MALPQVTMRVEPGAVCVVTGPNGSGKTTLLRIAAGLLQPSGGVRAAVSPALYAAAGDGARRAQTVGRAVEFAAALGGGDVDESLAVVDLMGIGSSRVEALSAGQRARVTLATVLAAAPRIACLDEPDAHLDDEGRGHAAAVVDLLARRGTAVLVATHDRRWLEGHLDAHLDLAGAPS